MQAHLCLQPARRFSLRAKDLAIHSVVQAYRSASPGSWREVPILGSAPAQLSESRPFNMNPGWFVFRLKFEVPWSNMLGVQILPPGRLLEFRDPIP